MTIHLTINFRAVILGVVLLLVAGGIATPFAISLADDGDERSSAQELNVPATTTFTYQGRLDTNGMPANGVYDFKFSLFDDAPVGAADVQIGTTLTLENVAVANGLFMVSLDFGASPFTGSTRWLSVEAKADADVNYALMSPRQPLSAVPYALFSLNAGTAGTAASVDWNNVANKPVTFADNVDNDTTYAAQSPLALNGTTFGFSTQGCILDDV